MFRRRSQLFRYAFAALGLAFACGSAFAQEIAYPTRSIQLVVPYSPGTTADILARLLGPRLAERWKMPVVTDNRPGATGGIGIAFVAKAAADGHTFMFVPTSFSMIPALYPKLAFDPLKSFAPVALIATGGLALVVHPQLPVKSVRDLIQLAKKKPGELHYSTPGNASAQHLAMELFKLEAGVDIVHVPHKGLSGALTDLMGGHVQTMISTLQTLHPYLVGHKLRLLAVTSAERSPAFPAVPTLKELGFMQLEIDTWYGALAPAGTPPAVVAKINAELNALLQQPDVRDQLAKQGMQAAGGPPERFGALLKAELVRWSRVIATAKIKAD